MPKGPGDVPDLGNSPFRMLKRANRPGQQKRKNSSGRKCCFCHLPYSAQCPSLSQPEPPLSFTAQGRPNLISLKDPPQPKYSNESSPQRGQGLDEGLEQEKLPTGCVHPWTPGNASVPQPQPGLLSEAAGDMSLVFCALPCTMIGPSVISTPSISPKVLHSPGPVEVWQGATGAGRAQLCTSVSPGTSSAPQGCTRGYLKAQGGPAGCHSDTVGVPGNLQRGGGARVLLDMQVRLTAINPARHPGRGSAGEGNILPQKQELLAKQTRISWGLLIPTPSSP